MYIFVGFFSAKSRVISSITSDSVSKTDHDAVCRALDWISDLSNVSCVEIWDEKENRFVLELKCKLASI